MLLVDMLFILTHFLYPSTIMILIDITNRKYFERHNSSVHFSFNCFLQFIHVTLLAISLLCSRSCFTSLIFSQSCNWISNYNVLELYIFILLIYCCFFMILCLKLWLLFKMNFKKSNLKKLDPPKKYHKY